jgi:hypothetical protein
MSYPSKIEGMVSGHYAEYEDEVTLAHQLYEFLNNSHPSMPYGYPLSVYHPRYRHQFPHASHFSKQLGGKLSNGVPKVLCAEIVGGYLLGVYNPRVR